ncbi:hypothetical protein NFI96_004530 [Prochilodus magdalenae]|nr:hypothetical protein NFI96_004530 [Prochilodus magdalenae]
METGGPQRASPLARELTRVFGNYNKHAVLLRRNLKETEAFFREMRHNYSNARASGSTTAALESDKPLSSPEAARYQIFMLDGDTDTTTISICRYRYQPDTVYATVRGSSY